MATTTTDDRLRKLRRRLGLPVEPTVQKASRGVPTKPAPTKRAAPPSQPSDEVLRKATEDAFQKGRAEGYADARAEVDDIMWKWFQKSVISSSRLTKSQADKLREMMVREDVATANDVMGVLRGAGVLVYEGEDDIFSVTGDTL
jgi:hypothetical protein